jgi:hypothetical protein
MTNRQRPTVIAAEPTTDILERLWSDQDRLVEDMLSPSVTTKATSRPAGTQSSRPVVERSIATAVETCGDPH